jgi:nucleotide-binding universal stress UspA family protein
MKNILVPVDFSEASKDAAEYAVSLAKAFDAKVTFINATPPTIMVDDSILASVMITQAEILENNQRMMKEATDALSKKYSSKITGLVQEGYPTDVIDAMAKTKNADLIVMGMKGKGRSNSVFGSTTTTIISKSTFPVFVIPEKAEYKPISNITFASDFKAEIEMARYTLLLELAKKFNSQVNILNVQKRNASLKPDKAIGKMRASIAFSKLNHKFHSISDKKVEEGINKFIEKEPTDILAMVAQKHNLFERMFGQVHTRAMSYQTKIPLLVLQS